MDAQQLLGISKRPRRNALLILLVAAAFTSLGCAGLKAPQTPIQISLWPGAQLFTQDSPVRGIALNPLGGAQEDVAGLDVGFFNAVDKELTGVGAGVANLGRGRVRGFQAGLGNTADKSLAGVQVGMANQADGEARGAQLGMLNSAGKCSGVQIGVVNIVDSTRCAQIGLFNLNPKGFLPFFPIFLMGF